MSQGRNPWSDVGAREALASRAGVTSSARSRRRRRTRRARPSAGRRRSPASPSATPACHLPHAMSYSVAGLVRDYRCPGYPEAEPLVPHGDLGHRQRARRVPRHRPQLPERHLEAAASLGADGAAQPRTPPELISAALDRADARDRRPQRRRRRRLRPRAMSRRSRGGAMLQTRLVDNAPVPVDDRPMRGALRRRSLRRLVTPDAHVPSPQTRAGLPALPPAAHALDGQRRLRPRQQRRLLRVLRHRHQSRTSSPRAGSTSRPAR